MKKLIFICVLLMTSQAFAQQKAAAVKFDEFSDYPAERVSPFYDRAGRFGEKMKRETVDKNAAIVFYNQRKGQFPLKDGNEWAKEAADRLLYSFDIQKERIILIDGGYREYRTLEFWIVPKGAELPKPSPSFEKQDVVYCPQINIGGDGFQHDRDQPLNFSVVIKGAAAEQNFPLEWSVSSGKIIAGQGTNQIKVDLSESNAENITAGLIVKNLPPECDAHAYLSTKIGSYPYKIDEFSHVYYSDLSARMDSFYIQLQSDPNTTGYAIIYGARDGKKKDSTMIIHNIRKTIKFRKFDPSRVKIIDGGFREDLSIEFYLVPDGAEPPQPQPTLNSDFVVEPTRKIRKPRKSRTKTK